MEYVQYDELKMFTDGGSRGNPGPAASGVVFLTMNDEVIETFGKYLGTATNNIAEWTAVKLALETVAKYRPKRIWAYLDSELVCKQINGEYRVKKAELMPFYQDVARLRQAYEVTFTHVYHEKNKLADAAVNKAIDEALGAKS